MSTLRENMAQHSWVSLISKNNNLGVGMTAEEFKDFKDQETEEKV